MSNLRLRGDRLRLLGEERNCRRGDTDLRLSGERLNLRRAGLVSRDLPAPSTRGRFLRDMKHLPDKLFHPRAFL